MALSDSPDAVRPPGANALPRKPAPLFSPGLVERVARVYVAMAAIIYVADLLRQTREGLTDGIQRPFGDDFINFWSGPFLALHHRASEIYDFEAFHAFEQSIVGPHLQGYNYSYPPMLLVLTAPFAFLPYIPGFVLWMSASWYAFYRALGLAMPRGRTLLLALATPAVFVNAIAGQAGMWTAALFGGGLGLLDRRPILAGSFLGLLIYKPQLGILIPVALVAGRRWRACAAAAASASCLVAISYIWLGPEVFSACLQRLELIRHFSLEDGTGVWHRSLSVFVAARRLGADVAAAYAVQMFFGIAAALAVAAIWFRNASFGVRSATLVLGTCLTTPYLQDYDLVFGALVVVWLWQDADIRRMPEKPLVVASAALLLIPLFGASLAHLTGLEFGPLFILPLFVIAVRCGLAERTPVVLAPVE